jgi:uncharacterized protein (TIGR00255 family)
MILSMTGFGEAHGQLAGHAYHVEIRSVNNRYFKSSIRTSDEIAFLEPALESLLRKRMTRGSVSLRISVRDMSESAAQALNLAAIRHYVTQLRAAADASGQFTIDLATLAGLPGVCQPNETSDELRQRLEKTALELTEAAIARLLEMRAAEGRALAADLSGHLAEVGRNLDAIRSRVPAVVQDYRQRLMQRIAQLMVGSNVTLGEADLLKEVAIFADRSDISEEIARLTSHLAQFTDCLASPEPAGRKLEFISQEMMREANTIGSKAGNAEIGRYGIEIKSIIDRIKEQVQNVE